MKGKSRRRAARKQRQKQARLAEAAPFDVHTLTVLDSLTAMEKLIQSFTPSDDPAASIGATIDEAVNQLVADVRQFDTLRLVEVARLMFLPSSFGGPPVSALDAVAAHVELLALIALAAEGPNGFSGSGSNLSTTEFVPAAKSQLDHLMHLSQLRVMATTKPTDKLAMISTYVRGNEVWMRSTSYADVAEATVHSLFEDCPEVRQALLADLGFSAADVLAVLQSCHDIQIAKLNTRMQAMFESVDIAMNSTTETGPDPVLRDAAQEQFSAMWEPAIETVTAGIEEIAAATGQPADRVSAIVDQFRLDLGTSTPAEVTDDFMAGRNPLRTHPVLVHDSGRIMLPHSALIAGAIKENFEEHLKSSPVWETYRKHRGDLLESRTRAALEKVLPGASHRGGTERFEYFIPATPKEQTAGDPAKYTKRVEGDHLFLLDDVAIVVEDKANALSALSRGGKVNRIRTDLTSIISKAAEQAGRLRDLIEGDGGVRVEGEGWVDLTHIREIHTITVSLDDLSSVATATAEFVRAGLLAPENICWTVSIHDLELITELIDRPAEFLLYLRRRRNPQVTVLYSAPDELDLFLYFFESGLWVEPDPDQERAAFPFLPEPKPAQRRRYRGQARSLITSRTDPLDRWHDAKLNGADASALKPTMVEAPLAPLADLLHTQGVYGWLSIGATLLSGAFEAQRKLAGSAQRLLSEPRSDGQGRSLTWPVTGTVEPAEGWLLVWATHPPHESLAKAHKRLAGYLKAKKHQLSLPRAVAFLYDEATRQLQHVQYDSDIGPLPDELKPWLGSLQPPEAMHPIRQSARGRRRRKAKRVAR
ncbi:hypothetical protein GCM10011609_84540 [Lentzea pudingi]|uniref:Preprotein translocase subunit SecA n=1 Tax=Lentzea pudingi TaxID=1789439 RepID=A0ABQ2IWA4_9PSEU|nr:preprotein translocase subunit SecA [Lentzea pudingi]GGN28420.1 hypothetical protein GCM10011609_84540 [Lentzea pudingi]